MFLWNVSKLIISTCILIGIPWNVIVILNQINGCISLLWHSPGIKSSKSTDPCCQSWVVAQLFFFWVLISCVLYTSNKSGSFRPIWAWDAPWLLQANQLCSFSTNCHSSWAWKKRFMQLCWEIFLVLYFYCHNIFYMERLKETITIA